MSKVPRLTIGVVGTLAVAMIMACGGGGTTTTNSQPRQQWKYRITTETSGAKSYIFADEPKPRLALTSDSAIADYQQVNEVLKFLGLPPIDRNVPNQEDITGFRGDRLVYVWNDYPLGVLRISHTLAGTSSLDSYDAIWKVMVESRSDKK